MPSQTERERRYWLFKTEPSTFSFDDLWKAPARTVFWDGVRNFQARNMLRDQIGEGDPVFVYHSSSVPTGIAGIAEVVRAGYPDHTAFDPDDPHFDPKSHRDSPMWYMVDIRAVKALPRLITLDELRNVKGLEKMVLLQKGSRLSIQPVSSEEWEIINSIV
ncbi:MAG TPA: EVE domain-containing protein [Gemmatimonadaceae bacterium]|nr:EVE domain-containing protein [Gemmatimonadaceae bacterium]